MRANGSVMALALRELETQYSVRAVPAAIVRVDVDANATLNFETVNGHESRWFRYRDQRLLELQPGDDASVPLARSIGANGSTTQQLLSYRPGKRLVMRRRTSSATTIVKGYRPKRAAAAHDRYRQAQRLLAATELRVPELLDEDRRQACLITANHSGAALEVSSNHEHVYALIGTGLRELQDARSSGPLDLHDAADEIAVLDERARRCQLATATLPAGWSAARRLLEKTLGTLPAPLSGPAHRDLHDRQFIVGDDDLTLLDFDLLCRADVTLDAANLLAHLSLRVLQGADGATKDGADLCGRALLDGLGRCADAGFWQRLRFYQAATFLRLSLVYFLRPHWSALAGPLVTYAERCLRDYERVGGSQ